MPDRRYSRTPDTVALLAGCAVSGVVLAATGTVPASVEDIVPWWVGLIWALMLAGTANGLIQFGASGPTISSGSGTPEGVVTAPVGSLYTNATGGAGTTLYVKQSGAGSTGWVAK